MSAPSVRRCRGDRGALAGLLAAVLLTPAFAEPVHGELAPIAAAPALPNDAPVALRLEVSVNGEPTHLVEPFVRTPDGHLLARRLDLEAVGVKVPGFADPKERMDLADLPGVSFRFDTARQQIDLTLGDDQRLARTYDARGERSAAPKPAADWGTILNYSAFGTATGRTGGFQSFNGANAELEARAFSPYGELNQTFIVGRTVTGGRQDTLRLDSTFVSSDPDLMLTGRAGDVITGGLAWTRPIRIGGAQLQRDFGLRNDLVTQPLPNLSGSAAVPSTVDVFVNNVKTFSTEVATGPYNISNLPVVSGNGVAHVVVTEATGRQTDTALPFFTTPTLLAPGLTDFSLDAGAARRSYGLLSDDYDRHPLASVTARHGLSDWLTLEAHAEGGAGLVNAGLGEVARLGPWGAASLALAASHVGRAVGAQLYGDYNITLAGFTVDVSTQRTLGRYNDLASVTATDHLPTGLTSDIVAVSYTLDPRPAKVLDRVTIGAPLPFDITAVSASFVNLEQANGARSRTVTASLSRPLPWGGSAFATGFADLSHRNGLGLFAGISMPLGPSIRASVGGTTGASGRFASFDVTKSLEPVDGSYGWRVRDIEGATSVRTVDAAYRTGYGIAAAQVGQSGRQLSTRAELDGSVGLMNTGGLFVGNRVNDGFALVDTGLPDIPVYQDNRLIGATDMFGKLLVSDLHANQRNVIGIDPLALPANAEAGSTRAAVSTAARSGVGLSFGIDRQVDAALVSFTDGAGRPLPVGSKGQSEEGGPSFVVGYEGKAYLKHLAAGNRVRIDLGDHDCAAAFAFTPGKGGRTTIGPVTCR